MRVFKKPPKWGMVLLQAAVQLGVIWACWKYSKEIIAWIKGLLG